MSARHSIGCVVATAAWAVIGGQASAATYDLSLTGSLANAQYSVVIDSGSEFDTLSLALSGLNPSNAITVLQGDVIHATITFGQSVPLPASVDNTLLAFVLGGTNFPNIETGTSAATISLFSLGVPVTSGGTDCAIPSGLAACYVLSPPDNKALVFDTVTANFTIAALGQPVVLDNATVVAVLARPVPEPGALALVLTGLGVLVAGARRRRRSAAKAS